MQRPDGDFGRISGGNIVHDIDVEVFRILSGGLDLAIFEGNGGTSGRSSEGLDLDHARRAGDVVGETLQVDIFRVSARLALQPHDVLDTCALDVRVSQRHLTFSSATIMQLQERTVSLGTCTVRAVVPPDLRCRMYASDRQRPLITVVNGPANAPAIRGPACIDRCALAPRPRSMVHPRRGSPQVSPP